MATQDEIFDSIYDWVKAQAGAVDVIWADDDDADFKDSHIMLRIVENYRQNIPDRVLSVDGQGVGTETITERAGFTLVVNCYGTQSSALALKLRASLWSSERDGFDALWKYMGLGGTTPIQELSALESAQIGARYEFRVTLHTIIEHVFSADYAETMGVIVNEGVQGEVINRVDFGTDPHPIPEDC